MNRRIWRRFRCEVPVMKTKDRKIDLNSFKRVYNREHYGEIFITFEQDWKNPENLEMKTWINLDIEEWTELVKVLWEIDQIMGVWITKSCNDCEDVKIPSKMFNRRLNESKLSEEMYSSIVISNIVNYVTCEFCGLAVEGCHCHEYDCHECSPKCFCETCGQNMYVECAI